MEARGERLGKLWGSSRESSGKAMAKPSKNVRKHCFGPRLTKEGKPKLPGKSQMSLGGAPGSSRKALGKLIKAVGKLREGCGYLLSGEKH